MYDPLTFHASGWLGFHGERSVQKAIATVHSSPSKCVCGSDDPLPDATCEQCQVKDRLCFGPLRQKISSNPPLQSDSSSQATADQ